MDLISRISENFSESAHLKLQSMDALAAPIAAGVQSMVRCLQADGKILACGNGGSAADAQHFSAELLNRFEVERPGLAAMALTTDSSTLTSIANDYDYNLVFSKQVRALGRAGDVLLAISTSGNSPNVLNACTWVTAHGGTTVGMSGFGGGKLASQADVAFVAPSSFMPEVEDVHIALCHALAVNLANRIRAL